MRRILFVSFFTFLIGGFLLITPHKALADITCQTCKPNYTLTQQSGPSALWRCINDNNKNDDVSPGITSCVAGSSCRDGGQGGCQCLSCPSGARLVSDNPPQNTRFVCRTNNGTGNVVGFSSTSACSQGQTCSRTGQGCLSNCDVNSGGSCDADGSTPCCIAGLVCKGGSVASPPFSAVQGKCQTPPACSEQSESCVVDSDCCNSNLKCQAVRFGTTTQLRCASACPAGTAYSQTAPGVYACITVNEQGVAPVCSKLNSKGTCAQVDTGLGFPIGTDPQSLIQTLFGLILSISGGIALLLIIISGYRILTSQGNPEALKSAREQLTAAIVGLLFIIFALVILQVIGVDILRIPGFSSRTSGEGFW